MSLQEKKCINSPTRIIRGLESFQCPRWEPLKNGILKEEEGTRDFVEIKGVAGLRSGVLCSECQREKRRLKEDDETCTWEVKKRVKTTIQVTTIVEEDEEKVVVDED
jgi:hypothetical protein